MTKSAFYLLHPHLQQMLYKMKWTELRPIQVDTINTIIHSDKNIIISAHTAGGKTEAAFLPILSQIVENKSEGIGVMYVGPLKALINDQFRRLEKLCEISNIPVFKWHGDVSSDAKKKFLKKPSGVLLITPESIESLFINHPNELSKLYKHLSFIVIDEMHSFMGTERGAHLKSLINRISQKSTKSIRMVGLSATLGDLEIAKKWLMPKCFDSIEIITDSSEKKDIIYLIKGYLHKPLGDAKDDNNLDQLISDIIHYFYGKTALIFINSRQKLEYYTDYLHRYVESRGLLDFFRIHHGSLSKSEREETENLLKSGRPTVAFCSSTLELGIDVGDVSIVGQIGPPWSVNSLMQRLGRSGRAEDQPSVMVQFIEEQEPKEANLIDRLYPDLLRSIALTELMREYWCEPPLEDLPYYSTFIQQILSIITERGGSHASTIYDDLVVNGTFDKIRKDEFIDILRNLKAVDLIDQNSEGLIFLGLKGEAIVRNYEFYSAFAGDRELNVIHRGKKIGSVNDVPDIETESYLILAGKRWKILEIDFKRGNIIVEPSKGGRLPIFFSSSGPDVHPCVREKMKEVVISDIIPDYLDNSAKAMLKTAQEAAKEAGLRSDDFLQEGADTWWFTWTGSAKHRTILALGHYFADLKTEDHTIAIKFSGITPERVKQEYYKIFAEMPSSFEIAEKFSNRIFEKYDEYLPERIQIASYAFKQIDTRIDDFKANCGVK